MIIALFPNSRKAHSKKISLEILNFMSSRGIKVVVEDSEASDFSADLLSSVDPKAIDLMISLGGDGTILRLVHHHQHIKAPILGINLGSLGFMADVPIKEIQPALQELVDGTYTIQERMIVSGEMTDGQQFFAVNDISIHRARIPFLIDLAIHVDGNYLNTFSADGIIVSTPSGSTAYSLSAGGPIISPELEALAITPICPHTISNRPIVLMPKQEIQIQYLSRYNPVEISFDGVDSIPLSSGEIFRIKPSSRKFRLVSLKHHDYFSTLRTKLGWSGKLRASNP